MKTKHTKADIFFDGKDKPYINIIVAGVGIRLPVSKKDKEHMLKGMNKTVVPAPIKIEKIEVLEVL